LREFITNKKITKRKAVVQSIFAKKTKQHFFVAKMNIFIFKRLN